MYKDDLGVDRLLRPVKLEIDADIEQADASAYPIHVTLEAVPPPTEIANGDIKSGLYRSNLFSNGSNGHTDVDENLETQVVHCKYLVGCDGAHSWVRK
jgi:phenol 2-monooxygenase